MFLSPSNDQFNTFLRKSAPIVEWYSGENVLEMKRSMMEVLPQDELPTTNILNLLSRGGRCISLCADSARSSNVVGLDFGVFMAVAVGGGGSLVSAAVVAL